MDSYVSTPQALEKIGRICRRVVALNGIGASSVRIARAISLGIGGAAIDVEIAAAAGFSFTIVYSIFDSDDDLAVRIVRELESRLPFEGVTGHELVYCWCGHSGDSWLDEKGDHCATSSGLCCFACHEVAQFARRRRLVCPCCVAGILPFDTARGRIQRCRHCRGLGYLKPSRYGDPEQTGAPAPILTVI
ncbi:MAG TPA: hypothetical protein VMS98_05185 [Thermoanaerobaculia bacterium]|nr:hypothetical protein [Thermoanaerobaculia bacterium]